MTRMFMVNPLVMCDQHLLGEHSEVHMLLDSINNGRSLDGYLDQHIVNPDRIGERHDELAVELERRGMNHDSPLEQPDTSEYRSGYVDLIAAYRDLSVRCSDCAYRMAHNRGAQVVLS